MDGSTIIRELRQDYRKKRKLIERRLAEFRRVYDHGDEAIFRELCFCIVTAGSSARMGFRTIELLDDLLLDGTERELQERARAGHVRFWRLRPSYICRTREYLRETCGLRLRELFDSFRTAEERRDFLAKNKSIKGVGYKEASHFLRNIGFRGYAILDKHIVNSLREMDIIPPRLKPTTRSGYLAIERNVAQFSREIGIDMDHLDLLLWSRKTGEILK
ncbi:MAG: N-glycosylase/DNA lyase [Nitrospiraceae bacterium]|nr:N-glycosylase/DNA lyase [Nitrospiraceae bacterium]